MRATMRNYLKPRRTVPDLATLLLVIITTATISNLLSPVHPLLTGTLILLNLATIILNVATIRYKKETPFCHSTKETHKVFIQTTRSKKLLNLLTVAGSPTTHRAVAANSLTTPQQLDSITTTTLIRCRNNKLDQKQAENLIQTLRSVTANHITPSKSLHEITHYILNELHEETIKAVFDESYSGFRRGRYIDLIHSITEHFNTTETTLYKILKRINENTQMNFTLITQNILDHPHATHNMVQEMLKNDDPRIRKQIIESLNSSLNYSPKHRIANRLTDQQKQTLMEPHLNDRNTSIRRAISQHTNIPETWLTQLATDHDTITRLNIATNPHTNPRILTKLATDPQPEIRTAAANHPNMPEWGKQLATII